MKLTLPIIRADFALADDYRYVEGRPPLSVPMTIFAGTHDAHVDLQRVAA